MDLDEEDPIYFPVKVLRFMGIPMGYNDCRERFLMFVCIPLLSLLYILILLKLLHLDGTIADVAHTMEAISSFGQILLKACTLIIYKDKLLQIFDNRKRFWPLDKFGPEDKEKHMKLLSLWILSTKFFFYSAIATVALLSLKPFTDGSLPQDAWSPEDYPIFYYYALVVEEAMYVFTAVAVTAYDGLFAILCVEAAVQFRLLHNAIKETIDNFDGEVSIEFMKGYVRYHNFLYRAVKDINDNFSTVFLVQYFVTVITTCMQLVLIIDPSTHVEVAFKGYVYIVCLLLQLSFYCFPASILTSESMEPANAIAASNWYKVPKIKIYLLMISMRAQKAIVVKAGGMFVMDRNAYVTVCRSAFSVFTLMRTIK